MAKDDINKITCHITVNGRDTSISFLYKQNTDNPTDNDTDRCLLAFNNKIVAEILGALSEDTYMSDIRADGMNIPRLPSQLIEGDKNGDILSAAAPSNKAAVFSLIQNVEPARRNGRFYLPGFPETSTDGNLFTVAQTAPGGPLGQLATALALPIDNGDPVDEEWSLHVWTNQSVAYDVANVHPVTGVVVKPQVFSSGRRTTRNHRVI